MGDQTSLAVKGAADEGKPRLDTHTHTHSQHPLTACRHVSPRSVDRKSGSALYEINRCRTDPHSDDTREDSGKILNGKETRQSKESHNE